ncbi:uncharacterized protein NESG_00643 [Nematocida ausubeli]|uniref:Uncharacterized protein n=1 Tax=Nematocida ausubeli (strain ATCC PRA-371 / ERTm2) TaxID=1913371 RepID=A0A086J2X8_NEMA1|nr:uncharacterized protein NESG_00643 [Nematocida ausubeli]KFG26496.1 hypothetical protein NESG_00643 [Nematocida ausubeli]
MINKILLNLMMVQSIFSRVSMEEIHNVHKIPVGEKQDLVINPAGPLNLLHGYIIQRNGYIYNQRFFSPRIEAQYLMEKGEISPTGEQEYKFKRSPARDKVYKETDSKNPVEAYLSTYHTQLIKMFPSVDGTLSIESGRSTMITSFLRSKNAKKDAKYILASLLLLSEGVDIKINIDTKAEKKKVVIKSKTVKDKTIAEIELYMAGIDPITNKQKEDIYQNETAEIVNFYIRCRDRQFLKKGTDLGMPSKKEEFESGRFLNNPSFLIQTYIYEFIDKEEDYKEFVEAVHELLVDQVVEKTNPDDTKKKPKKGKDLNKFFLEKDKLGENGKYVDSFYDLVKSISEYVRFPFYSASQLPVYTRVPQCKLDKTGFEEDESLYYSNCVETALLGLFCCLAYNPEKKEYEISHMGEGVSDKLKEFFKKYTMPTETTNIEMHKRWSKVTACLENDKIDYKKAKNELISGIINILLAIAKITGQDEAILELVEYIESAHEKGELDDDQKVEISNKIEAIITSLSLNKSVKVKCENIELGERSNGKADLFCKLTITYTSNDRYNGIALDVKKGHSSLTLLPMLQKDSLFIQEKYEEAKRVFSDLDSYLGYIFMQHADSELNTLRNDSDKVLSNLKQDVDRILQDGYENIPKIFLLGKFVDIDCKAYIMEHFMIYSTEKDLPLTDDATRWTANILGSVPLNDHHARHKMIKSFPFHAHWQMYYPKLSYKQGEPLPETEFTISDLSSVYRSILRKQSVSLVVKCMENYITSDMNGHIDAYNLLFHGPFFENLFKLIVKTDEIDAFTRMQSIIEKTKTKKDQKAVNYIYINWFIFACRKPADSLELIEIIYDLINFDDLRNPAIPSYELSSKNIKAVRKVLEEQKDMLCSESDPESMDNYNTMLKYFAK